MITLCVRIPLAAGIAYLVFLRFKNCISVLRVLYIFHKLLKVILLYLPIDIMIRLCYNEGTINGKEHRLSEDAEWIRCDLMSFGIFLSQRGLRMLLQAASVQTEQTLHLNPRCFSLAGHSPTGICRVSGKNRILIIHLAEKRFLIPPDE
jgi:hypothetical protein